MKIEKAKVIKGETLEVTLQKPGPDGKKFYAVETHPSTVHPDLLQAYANLRLHFALLSGYMPVKGIKEKDFVKEDLVEEFTVIGFSLKDGDNPGFVLTGQKKLANGKVVTVNTPFTRFEESEETGYKFIEDLEEKIQRAVKEVEEYLGGKFATDPQQQLPFGQGDQPPSANNNEEEEPEEAEGDPEIWEGGKRPNV
jgi:hypothetical protein